tara:strand:+ start:2129 stop:2299 length:171 start_codon:yes stop_codon:yes gene_type:complete
MKYAGIDLALLEDLAQYLLNRPMTEVEGLITRIRQAPMIDVPEPAEVIPIKEKDGS